MARLISFIIISLLVAPLPAAPVPKSPPPTPKKLERVPDPAPELRRELVGFDATYRNGNAAKFAELERRAEALANEYPAQADRARIWAEVAWVAGQSGINHHAERVRAYARKCLEISRDPLERGRMYSLLACTPNLSGRAFAAGRREAAEVLLAGYHEALVQELPETAPELPGVERVSDVGGGGIEEAQARARHAAQMAAREEAQFVRAQIERREMLVRQLRDLYKPDPKQHGHNPEGPEELRALAARRLTDPEVRRLMKKVLE